ncbi:MAG: hypothetical protein RJB38_1233 [Pseudomonadota bacterium]|jgi:hypothetical protein
MRFNPFAFLSAWSLESKFKVMSALMLGAALSGCGTQGTQVAQNPWVNNPWASNPGYNYGGCPAGTIYNYGYCLPYYSSVPSQFTSTSCTSQSISSTQVQLTCTVLGAYLVGSNVMNFPYLPSATQTAEAWWGPEIKANDKVTFHGAFRYGRASWQSLFGDCADENDGTASMKAAVGSTYLSLPMNQQVTVPVAGVLRLGMASRHTCMEYSNLYVTIIRNL